MSMTVNTNVAANRAMTQLNKAGRALSGSFARISSGLRISKAADDSAGLGVAENLKVAAKSAKVAQRNVADGISMIAVAEGASSEVGSILGRMRELAVQSASGTLGDAERLYVQDEFEALSAEVDRISGVTEFNGQKLLDGSASAGLTFQVGAKNTANDRLSMSITKLTTSTLGSTSLHIASASLSTVTNAQNAIGAFDKAIQQLSSARAKVGAVQNRMQITISNLGMQQENLAAANSRIRDVDVANETANLSKGQILSQAGLAVLAQANQLPQAALSLLR